jgi:hypothetical protein
MHGRIVEVIQQHGEFGPAIPEIIAHHLTDRNFRTLSRLVGCRDWQAVLSSTGR